MAASDEDENHEIETPPLHDAAKNDNESEVRKLLDSKADVNQRDGTNGTALHIACGYNAGKAAAALLQAKADVNACLEDDETPLHMASQEGHEAMIRLLVENGANVNVKNADGETPLHIAVQHIGSKRWGHISSLLHLGADPQIKDNDGQDVFTHAKLFTNRGDELCEFLRAAPSAMPEREADDPSNYPVSPDDMRSRSPGELVEIAEAVRVLGNNRFKVGEYKEAVAKYAKARLFLERVLVPEDGSDADVRAKSHQCCLSCATNAAACHLKLGDYTSCIEACEDALAQDSSCIKALFRKGAALRLQGHLDEAEKSLQAAQKLAPEDSAIQKEVGLLAHDRKRQVAKERNIAKKMFG
eukprot:gnl/MRDRNA2_/MRDRNA2_35996_c0_seq1.p1 gnl/MRDRNA2_/MRDRNA2_35996_c0~~gnl/MRDRNA2_/MRDRNA2_35996_c0_seq1.p1  ORF type:complete len:371 (-),score=92.83 gnl/MRDRNA2_/MRDRNA2_35996_c0_seq1:81-1151(-)